MSNDFDDKGYCTTVLAPLILNRQKGNKVVVKQNACLMCVDRENLADEGGSDTGSNTEQSLQAYSCVALSSR